MELLEIKIGEGNERINKYTKEIHSLYYESFKDKEVVTHEKIVELISGFYEESSFLLLLKKDQLIGMVNVANLVFSGFIFNLCVKSEYRKKGVGKFLLIHAGLYILRVFKKKTVSGSVDRKNEYLMKYYQKLGGRIEELGFGSSNENERKFARIVFEIPEEGELTKMIPELNLTTEKEIV